MRIKKKIGSVGRLVTAGSIQCSGSRFHLFPEPNKVTLVNWAASCNRPIQSIRIPKELKELQKKKYIYIYISSWANHNCSALRPLLHPTPFHFFYCLIKPFARKREEKQEQEKAICIKNNGLNNCCNGGRYKSRTSARCLIREWSRRHYRIIQLDFYGHSNSSYKDDKNKTKKKIEKLINSLLARLELNLSATGWNCINVINWC